MISLQISFDYFGFLSLSHTKKDYKFNTFNEISCANEIFMELFLRLRSVLVNGKEKGLEWKKIMKFLQVKPFSMMADKLG